MNPKHAGPALAGLVFILLFAVYAHGLNPAFNADDSPETAACAATLGIQHPPGYPLHTLVGRLFVLALPGNPAFRVNLMAAAFAALACALLTATLWWVLSRASGVRRVPGLNVHPPEGGGQAWLLPAAASFSAGLWLGVSKDFLTQALAAKGSVYTLQAAVLAGMLLVLQRWEEDVIPKRLVPQSSRLRLFDSRWFLLLALLVGAGLASHWETQVLFMPALAVHLMLFMHGLKRDPKAGAGRPAWPPLAWAAGLLALGLSAWIMLPLRSAHWPLLDWGHPADAAQFWWVVLRQEYTGLETGFMKSLLAWAMGKGAWDEAARQAGIVGAQGMRVMVNMLGDLHLIGWFFAMAGVSGLLLVRRGRLLAFCLTLIATFAAVITLYFHLKPEMIWILDAFMLPVTLCIAALLGVGLWWSAERLGRRLEARGHSSPVLRPLLALAMLSLPLALAAIHAPRASQRQAYWAWDYGRGLLASAKRDAVLLTEGDFNVMPLYYLQGIEGRRPDVDHATAVFLSLPWGVDHVKRHNPRMGLTLDPRSLPPSGPLFTAAVTELALRCRQAGRPFQTSMFHEVLSEFYKDGEPTLGITGLALEYFDPGGPAQERRRLGLMRTFASRHWAADRDQVHPSTQFMLSNYATAYLELANRLRGQGKAALAPADPWYKEALRWAPKANLAETLTHWGIALGSRGDLAGAEAQFKRAIAIRPLFEAWANLAGVYNNQKRYAEGAAAAHQAIELKPGSAEAWNNLGIAEYFQGRRAEAVAALEQAYRLNPSNPQVAANLKALRGEIEIAGPKDRR